jgi:hypothetical protein
LKKILFGLQLIALPLPLKTRFHQLPPPSSSRCRYLRRRCAAATTLPPPPNRCHQHCLCFHHHRCCYYHRRFRRRCRCCFLLIVDCLCPRHCCRRRYLHCHRRGARWQDGGGSDCRGHARQRCAVDALPAAAATAALPASCRCHHRHRASHRVASANDAALPAACLHCNPGSGRWQHGGGGSCHGHATITRRCGRRCGAAATAATTLSSPPCYCRRPAAVLPAAGTFSGAWGWGPLQVVVCELML